MSDRSIDERIAALARRQHGVFNHGQAVAIGATAGIVRQRVGSRRWLRLSPQVYALPGNPPTWRRQLKAAELGEPVAAISGRAAAALHELPGFRPCRPELVVPSTANARSGLARVRRSDLVEITRVDSIRAVTVAHLLHQLADELGPEGTGRCLDDAVASGLVTYDEVRERFVDLAPRHVRGLATMRCVLEERGDGYVPAESELERLLWNAIDKAALRGAVMQQPPPWWPDGPQRVDAMVPVAKVIIEADGRRWHTRVADFDRDRWRDNEAAMRGWRVLRFTWTHLKRTPAHVANALRVTTMPADAAIDRTRPAA